MHKNRCPWAGENSTMFGYHDYEWGVPIYDEQKLFEFLYLEGAQVGLSWMTILKRRDGYRKAFYQFDIKKVAAINNSEIQRLQNNQDIIRNRLKIRSVINNAQQWLKLAKKMLVSERLWKFVDGKPIKNNFQKMSAVPATSKTSKIMSQWLKQQGFSFVGETICYAFMQATGMVNDHIADCYLCES